MFVISVSHMQSAVLDIVVPVRHAVPFFVHVNYAHHSILTLYF